MFPDEVYNFWKKLPEMIDKNLSYFGQYIDYLRQKHLYFHFHIININYIVIVISHLYRNKTSKLNIFP